jgi:hypothetical protein
MGGKGSGGAVNGQGSAGVVGYSIGAGYGVMPAEGALR